MLLLLLLWCMQHSRARGGIQALTVCAGSGLGTYILRSLADDYPEVYRFTSAIFPSPADDVITSPYNSVLSLAQLQQYSDCVLPLENQALMNICQRISPTRLSNMRGAARGTGAVPVHSNPIARDVLDRQGARGSSSSRDAGFDDMNTVAAHVLTNLTCGMRFPGSLNVDLNEITMNLVPFPSLHFLVPSVAPLLPLSVLESFGPAAPAASAGRRSMNSGAGALLPRSIDSTFSDVITPEFQLLTCAPKQHTYLACGLLARGEVEISDMNRNVTRLKALLRMPSWNSDGFKVGLCSVAPVGLPCSVLGLANNSCMATVFSDMLTRFQRLFRRRAHLHHYTEHMELSEVQRCADIVIDLATGYAALGLGHLDRASAGGAGTKAGPGVAASRAGLAQPRSSAEDRRDPRGVRTMRVTAAAAGSSSGARQEAITRPSAGQPVRTQGVRTRARDGVAAPAGRGQSAGRASFTVLKRSGLFKALDSIDAGQADPRLAMNTDARHAVTVHDSRVDSSRRSGSRPVLDPHDAPDDMPAPASVTAAGSSEQLGSRLLDMYLALHTSPPTEPDAREVTDQKSDVE